MSTFKSSLVLVGLLVLNACSVGTVTASSHAAGGGGGGGGMGRGGGSWESSPRNVESARFDAPVADPGRSGGREPVAFRIEKDCWACR